ncbi:MAG: diguanylate cyclase [Sphingomonadaceae bacterium]
MSELLQGTQQRTLVFFDFDNFKAFNDRYGFAVGDRALLMFAELLLKARHGDDVFVGHVGGDDFFMSVPAGVEEAEEVVRAIAGRFSRDVESLYLPADRDAGGIWNKDRYGETRFFPLLRASAVLLPLPASRAHLSLNGIVQQLAEGKAAAKASADGVARRGLPETPVAARIAELKKL